MIVTHCYSKFKKLDPEEAYIYICVSAVNMWISNIKAFFDTESHTQTKKTV